MMVMTRECLPRQILLYCNAPTGYV